MGDMKILLVVALFLGQTTAPAPPPRNPRPSYWDKHNTSPSYGYKHNTSPSNYKPSYGGSSNYGSSSLYSPKYPMNANSYWKKKPMPTAVVTIPLCKTETIWLTVLVLDNERGKKVEGALVFLVDIGNFKHQRTDKYGVAKFQVTGCNIGLTVYAKDEHAKYKNVDLTSCTTTAEKVVVTLNKECNFYVFFWQKFIFEDYKFLADLVTFMWKSDHKTGHGQAVGGQLLSPLCIDVEYDEKFKMIATSQSGPGFTILHFTSHGDGAVIALPIPEAPYGWGWIVYAHIWKKGYPNYGLIDITYAKIIDQYINYVYLAEEENCVVAKKADIDEYNDYLIAFQLNAYTGDYFEGSVQVTDCSGTTHTCEVPSKYSYYSGYYLIVGCVCKGDLKHFQEICEFHENLPYNKYEFYYKCDSCGSAPAPAPTVPPISPS